MFCPGCGCGVMFHDAVNRMGKELVPHCENCGPCWRSVKTPFAEAVVRKLVLSANVEESRRSSME